MKIKKSFEEKFLEIIFPLGIVFEIILLFIIGMQISRISSYMKEHHITMKQAVKYVLTQERTPINNSRVEKNKGIIINSEQ